MFEFPSKQRRASGLVGRRDISYEHDLAMVRLGCRNHTVKSDSHNVSCSTFPASGQPDGLLASQERGHPVHILGDDLEHRSRVPLLSSEIPNPRGARMLAGRDGGRGLCLVHGASTGEKGFACSWRAASREVHLEELEDSVECGAAYGRCGVLYLKRRNDVHRNYA